MFWDSNWRAIKKTIVQWLQGLGTSSLARPK
jgi:hypothetical protein